MTPILLLTVAALFAWAAWVFWHRSARDLGEIEGLMDMEYRRWKRADYEPTPAPACQRHGHAIVGGLCMRSGCAYIDHETRSDR